MATTDTFYVSTKDNRVRRTTEPSREYFIRGGKKEGQAKYIIEVFGHSHEETAKEVRDMVDRGEMSDKIFRIKVEMR
jgi:hypothetical protein